MLLQIPKEIFKLLYTQLKFNPVWEKQDSSFKESQQFPCNYFYLSSSINHFLSEVSCFDVCDAMNVSCLFVLLHPPLGEEDNVGVLTNQRLDQQATSQSEHSLMCLTIMWWLLVSYLIHGTRVTQWRITVSISCHVGHQNTDSNHGNDKTKTSLKWRRESFLIESWWASH